MYNTTKLAEKVKVIKTQFEFKQLKFQHSEKYFQNIFKSWVCKFDGGIVNKLNAIKCFSVFGAKVHTVEFSSIDNFSHLLKSVH
jgi:hypothetical protein